MTEAAQNHPLVDSIRAAVLAARANGQGVRHLTLNPRDWSVASPHLSPGKSPGTAMLGPLVVKYGAQAKASILWCTPAPGDTTPGGMVPVVLLPWFEE